MVEDFVDPTPWVGAREAAVVELATDVRVTRAIRSQSRRMVRGHLLDADDFAQELWMCVFQRVRRQWEPARSPARGWVLTHLPRWAVSVLRSMSKDCVEVPTAVIPETPDPREPHNTVLVALQYKRLRASLCEDQQRHLDLRLSPRTVVQIADELGVPQRTERARWRKILYALRGSVGAAEDGR